MNNDPMTSVTRRPHRLSGHFANISDEVWKDSDPRIAVIAEDLRPPLDEGAKKTCFNIICSLQKQGASLSIFTRHKTPLFEDAFPLPENKLLWGAPFGKELRDQSPDYILYIPSGSGTIGSFVRAAVIKMQSANNRLALLNLQYRHLPSYARYLGLSRFVDVVFAQSQVSADRLQSVGCKTGLLPGSVDGTVFQPVDEKEKSILRSKYGLRTGDQVVLHVGHINRSRNVMVLPGLVGAGFRVILIASTSTPVDPDLLAELRGAGVMVITDFIENVQHYYQMADCYLFPVLQASSAIDAPLSVLEAMACNLPIVTTPFGALPGMFKPGNGVHFLNSENDIVSAVKEGVAEKNCRTNEMVVPYTWDRAAAVILKTLQGAGR